MHNNDAHGQTKEPEHGHQIDDDPGDEQGSDVLEETHEESQVDCHGEEVGRDQTGQLPDAEVVRVRVGCAATQRLETEKKTISTCNFCLKLQISFF